METKLSTKLKLLRKEHNYSNADIIKKLKANNYIYSKQSIYKWEDGTSSPDIDVLKVLAKIYHVNVSFLLDDGDTTIKNLTPGEIFILRLYRNDFLFRSIAVQILRRRERNYIV